MAAAAKPVRARCCHALLDEEIELVQIDRFNQMVIETAVVTFLYIVLHPVSGQRDSKQRLMRIKRVDQLDSTAVGQADKCYKTRYSP